MKAVLAAIALIPAMFDGALAAESGPGHIVLVLCSGGTLSVRTGSPREAPRGAAPCCAKGCRNEERKRRFDTGQ